VIVCVRSGNEVKVRDSTLSGLNELERNEMISRHFLFPRLNFVFIFQTTPQAGQPVASYSPGLLCNFMVQTLDAQIDG
jgi:hypothetical protein